METMRAARFETATRQLTMRDVPIPQPGPTEVLITIFSTAF
jgi:D-arabinose 1-dehydrogenase-like Zn-dependent alcohol dehydrogenase